MTDAEIIKALECCCKNNNCEGCPLDYLTFASQCASELAIKSLNLINQQQAENDDLFYKLTGVMHSVDKWLDGDELKQDEVNRAATMREKTLRLIETAKSEAIKEFAESLNEKVENARKKYQRLCKEQGEKEDEAMNIHFKGIIKLINNLVKEKVGKRK